MKEKMPSLPQRNAGLNTPANPKVCGRLNMAYRLISPPIDDPAIPVLALRTGAKVAVDLGFTVSVMKAR